ncbi:MAG TPA: MogA/MoaB family molybdenum cofactor biosynthesis protein [Sulfolobales archaeon]|nr:MogA/MoaB family molybdenum cofactor biosynthesis protein [Sulfolobales archaeon]
MKHPHEIHRELGPRSARVYEVTISTSRYEAMMRGESYTDESGDIIVSMLTRHGHSLVGRKLLRDDPVEIRKTVEGLLSSDDVDVIITTGGTGISRTDSTIEAIRPLIEKEIEGFGEIFRFVSFQRIGSAAMLTRTLAGVSRGKLLIVLPGSPDAVRTGLEIILPEIPHILYLIKH